MSEKPNIRRSQSAQDRQAGSIMPETARKRQTRILTALDGYANIAAGLGDYSILASSGTFIPNNLTWDLPTLTTAYRTSWLAKRIIDMPAEDMTRNWYSLSTSLPEEEIQKLKDLEARHSVKQEITNAIRWSRLYGGSIALMVIRGQERKLDRPLDPELLIPECYGGLLVLDRTSGITPSEEKVTDLDDPDFGEPAYYTVEVFLPGRREETDPATGRVWNAPIQVKIHHSRVLRFIGRELPQAERDREDGWGASELEHIWDELKKRENTSANIERLVFQANVTTLKSDDIIGIMATGTTEAQEGVLRALEAENQIRSSYGVQLLGSKDSMENLPYNFGGLSDIYEHVMMDMAGAAEIPATKLFGRSPDGMNATGEADLRNYYEMIAGLQERILRPALEKLLPVMAISCWGYVPEDLRIVFEPVRTMGLTEQMEAADRHSQIVERMVKSGVITKEQAREELTAWSERTGVFTKLPQKGA